MSLRIPTAGATGSSSPGVDCTVTRYCYPVPLPCTVTLYRYPVLLPRLIVPSGNVPSGLPGRDFRIVPAIQRAYRDIPCFPAFSAPLHSPAFPHPKVLRFGPSAGFLRPFPEEGTSPAPSVGFSPAFPARTCTVLYLRAAFPGISRLTVHLPAPSDGLESEEGTRKGFKRVFLQTLGRSKEHEKVLSAPSSYPHSLEW